jgi:hypothetical protein
MSKIPSVPRLPEWLRRLTIVGATVAAALWGYQAIQAPNLSRAAWDVFFVAVCIGGIVAVLRLTARR